MNLAPIALFVYNRPEHTYKTLRALESSDFSKYSDIYIFCDGAKEFDSAHNINKINEVAEICNKPYAFKSVKIFQNNYNLGLSKSIISGINFVLNNNDKIIVLEDDIVVSKGFLKYMNQALDLYNDFPKVGCIHGWNYPLNTNSINQDTFFLSGADCWGWATWKRAWCKFQIDGNILLNNIVDNNLQFDFNRRDTIDFVQMLRDQINGRNDSWAIRWHASLFIEKMFCLHPAKSMVVNIGLDSSGSNFGTSTIKQKLGSYTDVQLIEIVESEWFYEQFNNKSAHNFFKQCWLTDFNRKIKEFVHRVIKEIQFCKIFNFFKF